MYRRSCESIFKESRKNIPLTFLAHVAPRLLAVLQGVSSSQCLERCCYRCPPLSSGSGATDAQENQTGRAIDLYHRRTVSTPNETRSFQTRSSL